uniref:protein-serine/threonine phosphatase n=1 Tax=Ananas comosus var. bracteatus TaxID=296719 RepID=A0A6V7PAC9_ANACO|nr:unnamed protein product [Ananas comosus var. bracteatus]
MCVEDLENAAERVERLDFSDSQIEKTPDFAKSQMEKACENTEAAEGRQNHLSNFVPIIRSGDWSHIGSRQYMEDTHVCISDLAEKFGYQSVAGEAVSFYGVFDGTEEKALPISCKVIRANRYAVRNDLLSSVDAVFRHDRINCNDFWKIFAGRQCRRLPCSPLRVGTAIEMSKDHRPCCLRERKRVESLGGFVDDGYLNGQLGVTRALGDWHLEGMKEGSGDLRGPLISDPELKLITLTKDDEFLIIASDGLWDVFSNQNAVDFARRRLQEHNDVKLCCKELIDEAIKRGATDNLTIVLVCFHLDPPPQIRVNLRTRVSRSISAEGLHSLRLLLEGK